MNKKNVLDRLNFLENKRIKLFSRLDIIDNNKLNLQPSEGKWSIIQIVHHLYKSEQLSIVYIKRTLFKSENLNKSGLLSAIRGSILGLALKSYIKFNAPKNVSDVPEFGELEHYGNKWSRIRNDLHNIIEQSCEEILNCNIFSHPSVGKMNMVYALKFMESHFDHHKKQIDNVL